MMNLCWLKIEKCSKYNLCVLCIILDFFCHINWKLFNKPKRIYALI